MGLEMNLYVKVSDSSKYEKIRQFVRDFCVKSIAEWFVDDVMEASCRTDENLVCLEGIGTQNIKNDNFYDSFENGSFVKELDAQFRGAVTALYVSAEETFACGGLFENGNMTYVYLEPDQCFSSDEIISMLVITGNAVDGFAENTYTFEDEIPVDLISVPFRALSLV